MATTVSTKVLVVEDDDSLRQAIGRLLNAAGIAAVVFASAEMLLSTGAQKTAACVVSDLKLPSMSGLELLAALRAEANYVPLILMTAFDEPGLREYAIQCGAAAYLVKPFAGTVLLAAVTKATAGRDEGP